MVQGRPSSAPNRLVELAGAQQAIEIPPGRATIGRAPEAAVRLTLPGVSRLHASLQTHAGRTTIADLGSTNGTRVAGERITTPVLLQDGDVVDLGGARLQFRQGTDGGDGGGSTVAATVTGEPLEGVSGERRRTNLSSALLLATLSELVILGGAVAASFLTEWTGRMSWLVAPVVGVAVAMGKILAGELVKLRAPAQDASVRTAPQGIPVGPPAPAGRPPAGVSARRRRGTPVLVAVLVVFLVLGGGGLALSLGVRFVTGYVTGNEAGVERLAQPVSVTDQGLTLGVESVVHTPRFTRVGIVVTNGLSSTVTLPLYRNAHLTAEAGESLEADPFRSNFTETIPPGGTRAGTLVFPGHPPDGSTFVTLSFATVFEQGFDGPASLTLAGVALLAHPDGSGAVTAPDGSSTKEQRSR